jgi:hypothetical protein
MAWPERPAPVLRRFVRLLRVVLAITIVGALLHWVGPSEVRARFANCPPQVALGSLAAALLGQWLGAIRFQRLATARGLPLSRVQALAINLSTAFYGLFLPGGTAMSWLVRLLRLPSAQQRPGLALTVIAGDRAFATVAGALIGVAADLALGAPASLAVSAALSLVALVSGVVGWGLFTPSVMQRVADWPGGAWLRRISARAPQVEVGHSPATLRTVGSAIVLSIGVHGLGILAWWALAHALGLELGLLEIAWVRSAALAVGLLPVTVGGLGLREGTVLALLAVFGVSSADALSLSRLAFSVTVLGVGVLGGLGEAAHMMRRR